MAPSPRAGHDSRPLGPVNPPSAGSRGSRVRPGTRQAWPGHAAEARDGPAEMVTRSAEDISLPRPTQGLRGKRLPRQSLFMPNDWRGITHTSPPALSLAEHGADRGVRRRPAEIVGERATDVGDDPHVEHLPG